MAANSSNADLEDLSPSLVIPDYFSCSQSSTLVIIYDKPVGSVQDQVSFVFPGEVQGSPLKKVVPQRVDKRTFILQTPVYNISNRGFLYVTPQVRLASSGELKEMSDIKISLKHPVRSVMELCLKLSTQNAVLPVLLALMIHSRESEEEERNSNEYKLLEDAHFDRIMATLVGSIEPGTKYLREVLLPNRKWKKCSLEEFARTFKMQEMEKQAYLLRQRAKEKKRGKQNRDRSSQALSEDDLDDPFYPISQSQLSTSTPEIFRDTENESRRSTRGSRSARIKTLPQPPRSYQEDSAWNKMGARSFEEDDPNVYDPIDFGDNFPMEEPEASLPKTKKLVRKPIFSPGMEISSSVLAHNSWTAPTTGPAKKKRLPEVPGSRKDDDVMSLDSYEDMNEINSGTQEEEQALSPRNQRKPLPLPPTSVDPRSRPQLPLPTPTLDSISPSHQYSVSTKKKKKNSNSAIGSRPLPEPPAETSPTRKPPIKPGAAKQPRKVKRGGVAQSFRKKDIYVPPDSGSSDEDDCKDRVEFVPRNPPLTIPSRDDRAGTDDDHLYEAPELLQETLQKAKPFKFKKDSLATGSDSTVAGRSPRMKKKPVKAGGAKPSTAKKPPALEASSSSSASGGQNETQNKLTEYENWTVLEPVAEDEPDKPPPLPPSPHPRSHPPPALPSRTPHPTMHPPLPEASEPPRSTPPEIPANKSSKKMLPHPPKKPRAQKLQAADSLSDMREHKPVSRVQSNPGRSGKQNNAMAELSVALMNRNVGGAPPAQPMKPKKPKPVGGMKYI